MLISKFQDFYDYVIPNCWLEDKYIRTTQEIGFVEDSTLYNFLRNNLSNKIRFRKAKEINRYSSVSVLYLLIGGVLYPICHVEDYELIVDSITREHPLAYLHAKYNSPIILIKHDQHITVNPKLIDYKIHKYVNPTLILQDILMCLRYLNNINIPGQRPIPDDIMRDSKGHGDISFKQGNPGYKKIKRKLNKKEKKDMSKSKDNKNKNKDKEPLAENWELIDVDSNK